MAEKQQKFDDPYEGMSDEEFEGEMAQLFTRGTTVVSLRVSKQLLKRVRDTAERHDLPYQVLMKTLIEQGLNRVDRIDAKAS
jgi:predicted DNA binding CopG/RHH family protein